MTTPERLRRRQRIETALVAVTIALSAISVFILDRVNEDQDRCVAHQVTELTEALTARSDSAGKLNDATAGVLDSFVQAGARSKPGMSDAERQRNNEPILRALEQYAEVQADVKKDRAAHPFPPFPTGTCE